MIHGIDTSILVAAELVSHSRHAAARRLLQQLQMSADQFALAPQVLAEFAHVVTDPRRCASPLDMTAAIQRAKDLWNAAEVVHVFPCAASTEQFFRWMSQHKLGRKRLLDTMLAATFHAAGIVSIATLNPSDFAIFGCFTLHEPP